MTLACTTQSRHCTTFSAARSLPSTAATPLPLVNQAPAPIAQLAPRPLSGAIWRLKLSENKSAPVAGVAMSPGGGGVVAMSPGRGVARSCGGPDVGDHAIV